MQALSVKGENKVDDLIQVLRLKEPPEIQQAIDHPDTYRCVAYRYMSFEAKLPNGQQIYSFLDLLLVRKKMRVGKSLSPRCTNHFLVAANDKIAAKTPQTLEHLLNTPWITIYRKDFLV